MIYEDIINRLIKYFVIESTKRLGVLIFTDPDYELIVYWIYRLAFDDWFEN